MFSSRFAGLFRPADRVSHKKTTAGGWIIRSLICVSFLSSQGFAEEFRFRAERVLGASYELTVLSSTEAEAQGAHEAALAEILRLEKILSTWRADSEISRLNAVSSFMASQDLFDVLNACEALREDTGNALSCRAGKLIDVWRQAEEKGVLPDERDLRELAEEIAGAPVSLNAATRGVTRPANIVFAVDAVAKGWILDRAADRALGAAPGVAGVILNIGGDLKIAGDVEGNSPRIGISGPFAADNEAPMEIISISRGGVASSGGGKRDMDIAGRKLSHILVPATGQPQQTISLASVTAPTAAQADALATAFAVMGVGKSLAYANTHDGVEAVIVTTGGGRFASDGWNALMAPVEKMTASEAGVDNPWPDGYRLTVEYEIPEIDVASYEAPYVAVWITDQEKNLVRSLALLGDEPRWIEENHRFWRRYGRKKPALVDTLAQPTRRPGRYLLEWDGRNDSGAPAPQGTYTLHIEASREHGGHSYASNDLTLLEAPMEAIMRARGELGETLLHYGPGE